MNETFLLSNIAPQVGDGFNRHCMFPVSLAFDLVANCYLDWAYLEDWCRRLTGTFQDVYVFTIPLYLPRLDSDGKWRVVSFCFKFSFPQLTDVQTHEVIGSPPNVSVPTHFAKVVLASKSSSPSTPDILELSTGAFVLPNAIVSDEASLESFVMPGELFTLLPHQNQVAYDYFSVEAVERAAGLTIFSDAVKSASTHICKTTKCQVVVRRFDEAQKNLNRKAISAPK